MKIHVVIPVLDEPGWIFRCLRNLEKQSCGGFHVWICVNQPEEWWNDLTRRDVCSRNAATLERLGRYRSLPLRVLDRSSAGRGWKGKWKGVGAARRELMDAVAEEASGRDVIASLDADTLVPPDYIASLSATFRAHQRAAGLSIPYRHPLGKDEGLNRALLRYECYLRHYAVNLWRVGSPYAFTALGSALALPVWSYRRVGGIPRRDGGEDFYLLQKIAKTGPLLHWTDCRVMPAGRISGRVRFGTGPALEDGLRGAWRRYPIFAPELFDRIGETIRAFPLLHEADVETPLAGFFRERLRVDDAWGCLRRTHKDRGRFIRACHERLDGLRTFQYLRESAAGNEGRDEENLARSLRLLGGAFTEGWNWLPRRHLPILNRLTEYNAVGWSFRESDIRFLSAVRDLLMVVEERFRRGQAPMGKKGEQERENVGTC